MNEGGHRFILVTALFFYSQRWSVLVGYIKRKIACKWLANAIF